MSHTPPLTNDEFRARVLERFRGPAKVLTEADLLRVLDDGVFREYRMMSEYCQQLRLIGEAMFSAAGAAGDPDHLAQLKIDVDAMLWVYIRSILQLPHAHIKGIGCEPPAA